MFICLYEAYKHRLCYILNSNSILDISLFRNILNIVNIEYNIDYILRRQS